MMTASARNLLLFAARPALGLALVMIAVRFVTGPIWEPVDPALRMALSGAIFVLLAIGVSGAALAGPGARHRNAMLWIGIAASLGAAAIFDADYTDWDNRRVWGAAPVIAAVEDRPSDLVALDNGRYAVPRRRDGHFYLDVGLNGSTTNFMVDTGASMIALSREDARRAGVRLDQLDFSVPVSTAAGLSMAAPVTIDRVSLPGRELRDFPALVMDSGGMSLLGMTALEGYEAIEIRRDQLILTP